jgi:putative flippase GtrA
VKLLDTIRHSRFLHFAVVGTAGFMVNEVVLFLALNVLHLGRYGAPAVSFLCTVTFTWAGNRFLTFKQHARQGWGMLGEWAEYVVSNSVGLVVNYGIYSAVVTFAPAPFNSPYLALALGTITGLAFNFTLASRVVYRSEKPL